MRRTLLTVFAAITVTGALLLGTGRARAQVMPDLPKERVGSCQIPKSWGSVKTTVTARMGIMNETQMAFVLENEQGEIRVVSFACVPALVIGRE